MINDKEIYLSDWLKLLPKGSKNFFDYHSASAIESMVDGMGGVLRAT